MTDCIKKIQIDYCLDLSSMGSMYNNILVINKTIEELSGQIKDGVLAKTLASLKSSKGDLDSALSVVDDYLLEKGGYLNEKEPLTSAVDKEIDDYLEKSQVLANHFSLKMNGEEAKNPVLVLKLKNVDGTISLNERNAITSINGKKDSASLTSKDIKSSKTNKHAVEEAPHNDLYFLRTRDKWIPFFIATIIATNNTVGIAIFAKHRYEEIRKLIHPKMFKAIIKDYEDSLLLKDVQSLDKAKLYLRGCTAGKKTVWQEFTKAPVPTRATEDTEGLVNLTEIATPKDIIDELAKQYLPTDAPKDGKKYGVRDEKWVELIETIKKPTLPVKEITTTTAAEVRLATSVSDKKGNGNNTNVPVLSPLNIKQIKGNPLLAVPSKLASKYGYFYVKKDELKQQHIDIATEKQQGIAEYSKYNHPDETDTMAQASDVRDYTDSLLAVDKPTKNGNIRKGIKIEDGRYKLVDIEEILKADVDATETNAGLINLNKNCTVRDILTLAGHNLISRKTDKITGIRAGKLEYFNLSDYILHGNVNARLPLPKIHQVSDFILKGVIPSYKKPPAKKQIFVAFGRPHKSKFNKIIVYALYSDKGIDRILKKKELVLSAGSIIHNHLIDIKLIPALNFKGEEIENKWILFVADSSKKYVNLSIYAIEEKNGVYTIEQQIKDRELTVLVSNPVEGVIISHYTQKNGIIEIVISNHRNIAFYSYYDLDQADFRKVNSSFLMQKIQPFSNILATLVLNWATKQTAGHYIYKYIEELSLQKGNFIITSIIDTKDKIVVFMIAGISLTLVFHKKNNIIFRYDIEENLSFLTSREHIVAVARNENGNITIAIENENKIRRILVLGDDLNKKQEMNVELDSIGIKRGFLFLDGGISLLSAYGENITISAIKNKNITRTTDWKIAPDIPTETEAKTGDLYFIY